ncbi:hypothetical protein DH2020_017104 [Rehmannia glutinosa]|uniref:NAC domain-containing protein n=1 Tax=Rehmannia glutinosa TaxID=99300 RepID=A0ABR0WTE8_REHGL
MAEKCRIGSGPQNDWYFFSHKDKKYPTGTRTNRATAAGFWKATGRDKPIHLSNSKRIGMRKTLVFYTGRAPHGHKTDWIMHEYRLDDDNASREIQVTILEMLIKSSRDVTACHEDGWVICRVSKKKNHLRGFHTDGADQEEPITPFHADGLCTQEPNLYYDQAQSNNLTFDDNSSMHLPQLLSPESTVPTSFLSSLPFSSSPFRLTSGGAAPSTAGFIQPEKFSGDWSFLDKLLATHQTMDHITKCQKFSQQVADVGPPPAQRFPFSYHGFEPDFSKFSK